MTPLPAVRRPGGMGRGAAASDQLLCDETGNPFALLRCGYGATTDHGGGDWEYAIVEGEIVIGGVAHDSREWQPDGEGGPNAALALSRLQITISDGRGQWLPDARTRRRVPSMTGDYLTHAELLEQACDEDRYRILSAVA